MIFKQRQPGLLESLLPVALLVGSLTAVVILFKDDATGGPAQIALILSGFAAALLSHGQGTSWETLENSVLQAIGMVTQAILILLLVGALIGTWILAGVVPALVVWGLEMMQPEFFLATTVIICAIISLATGSSWSTAGTLGLALVGVGHALSINPAMTAGAVVSGSYFGDKLSPFSETTNLAASMTEVPLFTHIRHMLWTTIPGFLIAILLFVFLGGATAGGNVSNIELVKGVIRKNFWISPVLLFPLFFLFILIALRVPAIPALLAGSLAGMLCAVVFQQEQIAQFAGMRDWKIAGAIACFKAAARGFALKTDNATVNELLSRGGMYNMLTTVWLILSAMFFSGIMEGSGMLGRIAGAILNLMKGRGNLTLATLLTCIFMNVAASDQYLSIVLTGRMFRKAYDEEGLDRCNLSRALEDSGTLTSALVPWNTCGAFMASMLGVATFSYLPFAFLNLTNPIISAIYGYTGWTMKMARGKTGPKD